jgi:hypothetical protein
MLVLDIARIVLQAEAVRRAAEAVVEEWQDGIITTKDEYGGELTIACLRDALSGYLPLSVIADISNNPPDMLQVETKMTDVGRPAPSEAR